MTADRRSLGSVFGDIAGNIQQIFRGEIQLAKIELVDNLRAVKVGAGLLVVSALLGLLGLACLIAACVALLALVLPLWASALIVAGVMLAAAGGCAVMGSNELKNVRGLPRTLASLEETVQWPK